MTGEDFVILPERPEDVAAIEALHAALFGPGRFTRAASLVREKEGHDRELSFVAKAQGRLAGSVRQTRVVVGPTKSVLLGPLAVDPVSAGRGLGRALLATAIEAARAAGAPSVVLVGDAPYYAKAGFVRLPHPAILWPAPVDPTRVLAHPLAPDALTALKGPIRAARWTASAALSEPGKAERGEQQGDAEEARKEWIGVDSA